MPTEVDEPAVVALAEARAGGPLTPAQMVSLLAKAKSEWVAQRLEDRDAIVCGGDSAFEFDGEIWGKPHTPELARQRIQRMSGGTGVLWSGHWLVDIRQGRSRRSVGAVDSARVHFSTMTDAEIDAYVATGEPLEVAGSFTVDGLGQAFIDRVDGAPSCVVGLSVPTLRQLLGELDVSWPQLWER